jgi:hypothetical protein
MHLHFRLVFPAWAILLVLSSGKSYGQDFHERNFPIFSNTIGITDNHFAFINVNAFKKIQFYGGVSLFTERLYNQSFLVAGDFKVLNTDHIDLSGGLRYASSFSQLLPEIGMPVSIVLSDKKQHLFLLAEFELFYSSEFSILFSSEFLAYLWENYYVTLAYKTNPYFPSGDSIISTSVGLNEGTISIKAGISIPEDFDVKQALLTLSFSIKLSRFRGNG